MKHIRIIIEKSTDDYFWAYAENENITGGGKTPQACKQDILDAIETMKSFDENNRPAWLDGDYEITYKYDVQSMLNNYKGIISNPAFEKLTGINQKLMYQYSAGLKKPRPNQRKKIEHGLHQLGKELLAIEL